MIRKSELVIPEFYKSYVNTITEENLIDALHNNTNRFIALLQSIPAEKVNYAYALGKWTVKELLQHIIDTERVFTLRALWFARRDDNPLPGFDENVWADNANADQRGWTDMIDEFTSLRAATSYMFASFNDDQLAATGVANNTIMSTATLGFVCAGHVQHHMNILNERYGLS